MENFIYILIGIAWVAYSVYSARQKAIQKQQSSGLPPRGPSQSSPLPIPGNQSGGKNLFDEILRELSGEARPVPQVIEKPVMPVIKHQKNVSELNKSYEGHLGYKFITSPSIDSTPGGSVNNGNVQELRDHLSNIHPVSAKFDLRKAVIYSEILNRKYY